uniref:Tripartite motif-containing protein 5 n=2 Tax=Plecturocebus TaxID=1812035 RepID=TRIM5_PLEDO|nr:RecName: Full=Tripartite motif-containing protein 5; AltName: Full=RING-type E3 ubiquitin transferase TRIM5; AltName: Full=TRIM5alpha [Plecturocebus donacophilus]AAV91990.1 TRIM5alpha [Plecturocebus donacophilus]ABV69892.1 TRIM5alpha [Plecturocebus moloch]ACA53503.1 tripartite motif-containing protein 5 (predicted) [Plecturocebus moloch]
MASRILVNIKEEVTCPICLELLTEPLSLDCGHSFCQACITANHKESTLHQGERSCPLCRISYPSENLRPNRHLANIVERLREVVLSPEEGQKVDLCARHGEKLLLFCQQDGNVICWLCERSQEHRGHHTFLVEEVAQTYRENLQVVLEMMRQKHQDAEKLEADVREEQASWKIQIQNDKTNIMAEFKQLRDILDCEESNELQNLEKEEKNILKRLVQSENDMVLQTQSISVLISDLEHRLQGSVMELLQGVDGVIKRVKNVTLQKPKTFLNEKRRVFRVPDLKGMLQVSKELTEVQRYWAHVTLVASHPSRAVISEDERQVRYQEWIHQSSGRVKYFYGVLGSPSITSGKHYWEVDVSNKSAWILGVCVSLKCAANRNGPGVENYQPKNGYWVIGLRNADNYSAFQDSVKYNDFQDGSRSTTYAPLIVPLFMTICPNRVGVFLDYEACTVSFFNVTSNGFLIYKFSNCHFSYPVFPYFSPMTCELPMTLCSPRS